MEEVVTINKIQSSSVYHIPVHVGTQNIEAIIDTAADTFRQISTNSTRDQKYCLSWLYVAGRDLMLTGYRVQLRIGSTIYREILHGAPMEDGMLLGIDFLLRQKMKIDTETNLITLGKIPYVFNLGNKLKNQESPCHYRKKKGDST